VYKLSGFVDEISYYKILNNTVLHEMGSKRNRYPVRRDEQENEAGTASPDSCDWKGAGCNDEPRFFKRSLVRFIFLAVEIRSQAISSHPQDAGRSISGFSG
jgi:hypothetical protein